MSTRRLPTYINIIYQYLMAKKSHQEIVDNYFDKADELNKFINKSSFNEKLENHISNFDKLFDIASCKCTCICRCQRYSRIPNAEKEFLKDQRSTRVMLIGDAICSTSKQSRIAVNNTTERFNLILM